MPEQLPIEGADKLDDETLRQHSYGGTPLPLIRQIFDELCNQGIRCDRFLEPGSGPAPFCKVAREIWSPLTLACEIREEEEDAMMLNVDTMMMCTFDSLLVKDLWVHTDGATIELAATNPPFSMAVKWAQLMLKAATRVLLLLPSDFHSKSEKACDEFEDSKLVRNIAHQWLIPGRIGFYGGSNTDRITYSWWLFTETGAFGSQGRWPCARLPRLPTDQRRWAERPGTETT